MRSPGIRLHKLALFAEQLLATAVLLLLSLPVLAAAITMILEQTEILILLFSEAAGGGDPILTNIFSDFLDILRSTF